MSACFSDSILLACTLIVAYSAFKCLVQNLDIEDSSELDRSANTILCFLSCCGLSRDLTAFMEDVIMML